MVDRELQSTVDALAERLQRSVAVDDAAVRPLYVSPHYGDEDPVRVRALLQRHSDDVVVGHVLAQGVATWTAVGTIPARPDLGMSARLCVPVRWRSELLGLIMVIDPDTSLTAGQVGLVTATAQDLAPLLASVLGVQGGGGTNARESAVADLIQGTEDARRSAVRVLQDGDRPGPEHVVAIALRARAGSEAATTPFVESVLRVALTDPAGPGGGRPDLVTFRPGSATRLLCSATELPPEAVRSLAQRLVDRVNRIAAGRFGCVAGIGRPMAGLGEAWASARQAEVACDAAGHGSASDVVDWTTLGAAGVLLRLPAVEFGVETLPHELQLLLRADPERRLLPTLRAYLDAAGNGPAAATVLHIHRTTLYYRLERISELTGLDLADGRTRLSLHVGLVLLDLLDLPFDRRSKAT